jgi:hypothetical protein
LAVDQKRQYFNAAIDIISKVVNCLSWLALPDGYKSTTEHLLRLKIRLRLHLVSPELQQSTVFVFLD